MRTKHDVTGEGGPTVERDLEPLLDRLLSEHATLNELFAAHREAIRRADGPLIERVAGLEEESMARIRALDQRRLALAGGPAVTITQLAQLLPEERRQPLLRKAETLREVITEAHTAQRAIRIASRSILSHLQGLMGRVGQRLSHAGTYGRDGAVGAGATVVSGLDIRM